MLNNEDDIKVPNKDFFGKPLVESVPMGYYNGTGLSCTAQTMRQRFGNSKSDSPQKLDNTDNPCSTVETS